MTRFFVTARLATQADSTAFTDGLLDQLAALTGEQVPPAAPAAMQGRLRRQLLERAVKAGRQLVLVADGPDEDYRSRPGSWLPSIAACLSALSGHHALVPGRDLLAVQAPTSAVNHTRVGEHVPYPPGVPAQHRVLVPEHRQFSLLGQLLAERQDGQSGYKANHQTDDLEGY